MVLCCKKGGDEKDTISGELAIKNYLRGGPLQELFEHFDKDGDDTIKGDEFKDMIADSLLAFAMLRDPDINVPTKESIEPFCQKLMLQLEPYVGKGDDVELPRSEFAGFGLYLKNEYRHLQHDLEQIQKELKLASMAEQEKKTTSGEMRQSLEDVDVESTSDQHPPAYEPAEYITRI